MRSKHLLIDTSQSQFARDLLRSAEFDEPPAHAAAKLAIALGLGSSALVSTVATGAAASTQATIGTAVATAGKGVAAAGTVVPLAGATVSTSVAGSTAALPSAVGLTNIASSAAVLSSASGVSVAAAPAVGGALSAVGMLKTMAIVSLTCGALSFGGTKLAITIANTTAPAASSSSVPQKAPAPQPKQITSRSGVRSSPTEESAVPHAVAELGDTDDEEVLPALVQEARRAAEHDRAHHARTERNVGRQDIEGRAFPVSNESGNPRGVLDTSEVSGTSGSAPVRRAAIAAFPSDEEPTAPSLNAQPERKPKLRLKARKTEPAADAEREQLLLDRASRAISAGQPLVALQALDAYRSQAHRGTLRTESLVLRVKALLALGQKSAAEREAMPFIKAAPGSRYAARLRGLLGVPNDTP